MQKCWAVFCFTARPLRPSDTSPFQGEEFVWATFHGSSLRSGEVVPTALEAEGWKKSIHQFKTTIRQLTAHFHPLLDFLWGLTLKSIVMGKNALFFF